MKFLRLRASRKAFTLVELLVVVSILLITTYLTVVAVNGTLNGDRLRSSARQIQSAILGARDRAVHAKEPRGLRLLLDSENPRIVRSMVFVGPAGGGAYQRGTICVGRPDSLGAPASADGIADSDTVRVVRGYGTFWKRLYDQGLLVDQVTRIRIPADTTGRWYTVRTNYLETYTGVGAEVLILEADFQGAIVVPYRSGATTPDPKGLDAEPGKKDENDDGVGAEDDPAEYGWFESDDDTDMHASAFYSPDPATQTANYILELSASVLPGQEPMRLASGIVVDLIPPSFGASLQLPVYTNHIDIMFTPRGTISGALAARGLLHFYLRELDDVLNNRGPLDPKSRESLLVTLFPQTGYVAAFPIDVTDTDADSVPDHPLSFAQNGGLASK